MKPKEVKTVVVYSALGLGTAIGTLLLGRFMYKQARTHYYANNSIEDGDPATYARQLQMAFENDNWMGWGTNEKQVFDVFRKMPSKAFYKKVQNAYNGLFNKDLTTDLQKELSSSEYNQAIMIISAKK